jgi:hypothetical protein
MDKNTFEQYFDTFRTFKENNLERLTGPGVDDLSIV